MVIQVQPPPTISTSRAEMESLLSIMVTSARNAMDEYEKSGHTVPKLGALEPHPSDNTVDWSALAKFITIFEGSCSRLVQTLAPPIHTMRAHLLTPAEQPALRVAVECKITDILATSSEGMHVTEIAKQTPSSVDPQKLARILRFMVSRGYFREVSPNVFANNRLSSVLVSSNPLSSLLYVSTKIFSKGFASLPDVLTNPDYGFSDEPEKAAFIYSVRHDFQNGGFFDWLQKNPTEKEHFAIGMVGLNNVSTPGLHCPVWSNFPAKTSICDVGSGIGGFSIRLAKVHSTFKFVLFDRPEVISQASKFWDSEYPDAIQDERVTFTPGNFMQEVPGGHDLYFARHIIHDWPDSKARVILRNIRKAMRPDSRLFIEENILPHSDSPQDDMTANSTEEAFLTGSRRLYHLDMIMLSMMNGKERAQHDFKYLASEEGLKLSNCWDLMETSLLEFVVADVED